MSTGPYSRELVEFVKKPRTRSHIHEHPRTLVSTKSRLTCTSDANALADIEYARNSLAPILVFFQSDPSQNSDKLIGELCSTLGPLKLVPKFFSVDGRKNIQEAFSKFLKMVYAPGTPDPSVEPRLLPIAALTAPCYSRYKAEFQEIGKLGEGGFGTVYKVKSTYDNAFYAVKKIKLKKLDNELTGKILSEVQLLASLNHQNIIRYHCGWVEESFEEALVHNFGDEPSRTYTKPTIVEVIDDSGLEKLKQDHGDEGQLIDIPEARVKDHLSFLRNLPRRVMTDSDVGTFAGLNGAEKPPSRKLSSDSDAGSFASLSDEESGDCKTRGKFWKNGCSTESDAVEGLVEPFENTISASGSVLNKQLQRPRKISRANSTEPMLIKTIFIQMELCTATLEQYLIGRNKRNRKLNKDFPVIDGEFNLDVFLQLLSALQYIHHNHIIHRDIKPGNIFLKADGRKYRVLLGDFGLACFESSEIKQESDEETTIVQEKPKLRTRQNSVHSIGVGTTTYAAPEQLDSSDYGPTVDLYSAGIVLFEIYNVFATHMERLKAIEQLRRGRQVTPYMEQKWGTMVPIIIAMTDPSPSKRPTAGQLLTQFKADENEKIRKLEDIIKNQKDQIRELEKQVTKYEAARTNNKKPKRGN